jgi:hypothetical protein
MDKPAVRRGTVPVLHIGADFNDVPGTKFLSRFTLFLIVASATRDQQNLSARMLVLAVAAARVKGHVPEGATKPTFGSHKPLQLSRPNEVSAFSCGLPPWEITIIAFLPSIF